MPLQYSGILEEHAAVRSAVGLFDVSHMGEIEIHGADAAALTDYVTTNAARKLQPGQAQYSGLLYEHAGFVDDILVHKVSGDHYFLCVNASNQEKDYQHIAGANGFTASVDLASDRYSQLAIQGPFALATLQKLTAADLTAIRYYHFIDGLMADFPARIARTGYTGEDGFEIYFAPQYSERIWSELLKRRPGIRHQAVRPGRPQHTPSRSRHGALWPRNPFHDHAVRGRARLDRQAG
jgi:aminomethyltransferase